jgi:DNA-binding CsgD family transcriptional regulator
VKVRAGVREFTELARLCRLAAREDDCVGFRFDAGEIRTLERLLSDRTAAETVGDLGVSVPTMRTHLAAILPKTGTSRQSELVLLVAQLAAPARRSCAGDVSRDANLCAV